jgi:hypothetical protein
MGVAPSVIFGRGSVERHEHFDPDGVFTGVTVVHRSPEFTREDVALLLAMRRQKAEIGPHGFSRVEATDPDSRGKFEAYPITDWVEHTIAKAAAQRRKEYPDDPGHGLKWGVRRRNAER